MKLSVKVQEQQLHQSRHEANHQNPLLLRAKVPITIFGLPFLSGFATTSTTVSDPSNLSLSLSTNFSSGPSLKLSYNTSTTVTSRSTTNKTPPFTLSLKSGIGLYGSPADSPIIISADFAFSPQNPCPNPTFSLHFKPRLGDFSLRKTVFSNPNPSPSPTPNPKVSGDHDSFVFVPLGSYGSWKSLTMGSGNGKDSILSGFTMMARTEMPVTKRVALSFRWGLNLPSDVGKHMPFLTVNKIGIERIVQVKETKEVKEKSKDDSGGDLEMLKGMYFWMKKELDVLRSENREIKNTLDEMKLDWSLRHRGGDNESVGRKSASAVENSGGFEQWRSKKNGVSDKGFKESKKNGKPSSDVEIELQKAIKAASSQ